MGKVAFIFPGQGAQKVGMGKDAFEQAPAARAAFEAADAALGESLSGLCFEGPEEDLKLTANTQPAILTTSVALLRAFGENPDVTAGHSLGEYSANVCAGTIPLEDAVRLVRLRGQFMQEAVPVGEGAMAAVMGLGRADVDRVVGEVDGVVESVNYNSPQQTVIAGAKPAVEAAMVALKEAGGKAVPLPVSAPFHSSMMRPAEERLLPYLTDASFSAPSVPIYVNVDAAPVIDVDGAKSALARQVSRAVRWQESVEQMVADGVTLFVEIGPGRVLQGLVARIDKRAKRVGIQGPKDFDAARQAIAEARAASN